jgi:Gpi18-like mannosyltransferase
MSNSAKAPWRQFVPLGVAFALVAVSLVIRVAFRGVITSDLDFYVLRWYAKFRQLGIGVGLGKDFYNYSPPYVYLLALATLTSGFVRAVTAVKLISTAFDVYAACVVYKIVRLRFQDGYTPHLAAALFFCAPTIVANAAVWGQADSTYTAFLLTCLYFLMLGRPQPAVLFFSIAFAFKPQAIFLAPLLLILFLWKKIPWYSFLLIPAVYLIAALPAVALGRTWLEVLSIYLSRPQSGKALTHNAASLYVFVPREALEFLLGPGVLLGATIVLVWVICSRLFVRRLDRPAILLLALISAALTPFVLPNMHDRYFYPADAISIPLAFTLPELWFIPILFQLVSGLSYSVYLLSAPIDRLQMAAVINLFTVAALILKQVSWRAGPKQPVPSESSHP